MNRRNSAPRRWPQLVLLVLVACIATGLVAFALLPREAPEGQGGEPVLTIAGSGAQTSQSPSPSASSGVGLTVAFVGDSFTTGLGASDPTLRWSTLLAEANGWSELNFAVSGTSYGAGASTAETYAVQVDEAVAAAPDVVVVSGGLNMREFDQSGGVESVFAQLRDGLPAAQIVAVSPFWVATEYPEQLALTGAAVKTAVEGVDGVYLDVGHLFEGEFGYFEVDGLHPDDEGHQLIANAIDARLPVTLGG